MIVVGLAALVGAAIAVPHLLRLERAAPGVASTVWLSALVLRALAGVFLAVFIVLYVPTTMLFDALTHWCWHAVIPVLTSHLGLDGHRVGDAATIVPGLFLAGSLVSMAYGLARTLRAVRRWLRKTQVGPGPRGSVVVADQEIVLAAAGLRRPQIVVSAGALVRLDDDELAAGLAHERGHIARRHRFVALVADGCRALGRLVPGTGQAARELTFHLERDADRWAVTRARQDPCTLASAICKAAVPSPARASAMSSLAGGGRMSDRLRELLDPGTGGPGRLQRSATRALAAGMATLALALAGLTPTAIAAGVRTATASPPVEHCDS
ncbi:MAG: M48 family metalloprotease [Solirubrobacteraceae bacterium]